MISINDLPFFLMAVFVLAISPGPNMIYLISRSLIQGKKAGLISLAGVVFGFLFHIILVSFGLTAVLLSVPLAYFALKTLGTLYLLYLAFQAFRPNGRNIFDVNQALPKDSNRKLFSVGFLTNVLNPKVAIFYVSLFPQFIKPEYGSVLLQSLELGTIQVFFSFGVNALVVLSASKIASFFHQNPLWIRYQRWFMGSILCFLALKMAFSKVK